MRVRCLHSVMNSVHTIGGNIIEYISNGGGLKVQIDTFWDQRIWKEVLLAWYQL